MYLSLIHIYLKELKQILLTQQKYHSKLTDEVIDNILYIIQSKREFWEGPGASKENQLSPYGSCLLYTSRTRIMEVMIMSKGKGVSSHTHTQSQINHYANQHNTNNSAYQANNNNHANQCNPNNSNYQGYGNRK